MTRKNFIYSECKHKADTMFGMLMKLQSLYVRCTRIEKILCNVLNILHTNRNEITTYFL